MVNKYGGEQGTDTFYVVEARSCVSPKVFAGDFILTEKWQRVPSLINDSGIGVPVRRWGLASDQIAMARGLMNYTAAVAFAQLFLAQLDSTPMLSHSAGIEVRLVKVKLTYSYGTEEIGVGEIINRCDGDIPRFTVRETDAIPLSARHAVTADEVNKS